MIKRTCAAAMTLLLLSLPLALAADRGLTYLHPRVAGYGKVVRLADAADQPQAGSKICVDVTTASSGDEAVNPALDKVARFVNIYAGAGGRPASCTLTVVLHGSATQVALSDAAYARHMQADGNPNLPLVRTLRAAGVEFLVCGQAMAAKGYAVSDTADEVSVAVSALTVNVNRQAAGFAFIPLR